MQTAQRYLTGILAAGLLSLAAGSGAVAQPVVSEERPSIADMLENVTPAVVNIAVTGRVNLPSNPLYNDPLFRRFFNIPDEPQPRTRETVSVGSGVIIDAENGYVVTNHHVIENAESIQVTLRDRRQVEAKLIGSYAPTDIALLQIEAGGLQALPLGDSNTLRVGDFVVAIGNPFGIGQTVTSGIVSALSRTTQILGEEGLEDFIQTDASINPGNSGGALVDYNGVLVGINSAIISGSGGNVGIGFAVPINMAKAVVDQLIEYGEVSRGQLGVYLQDLTPAVAEVLELDVDRGAVVSQVLSGTPAERAGLRPGDVIIRLNDRPIEGMADLRNSIGLMRPETEITLTLLRDGEERTVEAVIGRSAQTAQALTPSSAPSSIFEGAELRNAPGGQGVEVVSVAPNSRAARNGLQPGDRIIEVNRQDIATRQDLDAALAGREGGAAVTLLREGREMFFVMR